MAEKIPARFRKTKSDKWAVMAPVEDLEKALAGDGKVDVLKKSGDWTTFRIVALGRPFDVDGVDMCYGYAEQQEDDAGGGAPAAAPPPPPRDDGEPLPEYQGGAEDEWRPEF